MRFLIECTYVYDHPWDNSGIQRVVRNVVGNLPQLETPVECVPVVLKQGKVYRVTRLAPPSGYATRLRILAWLSLQHDRFLRQRQKLNLYRMQRESTGPFARSRVLRGLLRLFCKAAGLAMAVPQKCLAHLTRDHIDASRLQELECEPEDVLILLDSSWHADFFPVAERLKSRGVRIVSVIYDLIPLTHPQFCDDGLVRVFENWFDWVSRTADGFIAISETIIKQVRREVQHRLGHDAAADRWFDHFHLGSDLDQVNRNSTIRPELKRAFAQRHLYLMVSTIEPRKNHSYLLDAFEQLWAQGQDVSLCFVGKVGWKTEQLIDRINRHPNLDRRLFMWNDLSDRELEYCYKHARALVFPSYVEGFGLPLVEAMQRGLPVMASDIPVFREIGRDAMAYFDLATPDSLAGLVRRFEDTDVFPARGDMSRLTWLTWRDSTSQLVERVYRNTEPGLNGGSIARRA